MRARVAVCFVVAACGGATAREGVVTSAPAAPSCSDVGVILRGAIDVSSVLHDDAAGPAREAVIAKACEGDHWSEELVVCVVSNRHPASCLDKLTAPQRTAYDAKLAAWAQQFGGEENGEEGGEEDGEEGGVVGGVVGSLGGVDPVVDLPRGMPIECTQYRAIVLKIQSCDPMPIQAREAMKQAFNLHAAAWGALPADQLPPACKAGYDAIFQSGKGVCGW